MVDLRTVTIARDVAEEEAETAYDALSEEVQELRDEVAVLRCEVVAHRGELAAIERGILEELVRLREALG